MKRISVSWRSSAPADPPHGHPMCSHPAQNSAASIPTCSLILPRTSVQQLLKRRSLQHIPEVNLLEFKHWLLYHNKAKAAFLLPPNSMDLIKIKPYIIQPCRSTQTSFKELPILQLHILVHAGYPKARTVHIIYAANSKLDLQSDLVRNPQTHNISKANFW